MRTLGLLLFFCLIPFTALPQQNENPEAKAVVAENAALDRAISEADPTSRIKAIEAFLSENPDSDVRPRALEHLAGARAAAANTALRKGEVDEGVKLFKLAVSEAPDPATDDFFSKVLANIPTDLFMLGERNAAFEIAEELEARAGSNNRQLLRLATFFISIKYATGARRLAEKALNFQPDDSLGYQSLGLAARLGFDLEGATNAYARALELEPDSLAIRQSLGEMKRATGRASEAEGLFREILASDSADVAARTGLILALFDQDQRDEAEERLVAEISANPKNGFAMIGAANWYNANGEPDLAIGYAKQALALEEGAVWAYIVLARAYMLKNKPVEAERILVAAEKFANLPTLSYELALIHSASGFYYGAAQELKKHFRVENGKLVTELDGRVGAEADNFTDLVGLERKSFIFTPVSPYDGASDEQLKRLLFFEDSVTGVNSDPEATALEAVRFAESDGRMRTYRQLYAAKRLLDTDKNPEKAMDLVRSAVEGVETSVEIPFASTAVLADQLYESKEAAAESGRVVVVPEIDKPTLINILRGRIEELSARSLIAEGKNDEAAIRLKRAVSVLPKDSAWWRSSLWRLGQLYETEGNDDRALQNYAASYSAGNRSLENRSTIESVYSRVNGSLDGLDAYLEKNEKPATSAASLFLKTAPAEPVGIAAKEPSGDAVTSDDASSPNNEVTVARALPRKFPSAVPVAIAETGVTTSGDSSGSVPEGPGLRAPTRETPETDIPNPSLASDEVSLKADNEITVNLESEKPIAQAESIAASSDPPPPVADGAAGLGEHAPPPAPVAPTKAVGGPPTNEVPITTGQTISSEIDPEVLDSVPAKRERSLRILNDSPDRVNDAAGDVQLEQAGPPKFSIAPKSEIEKPRDVVKARGLIDLGATRPRIVPPEKIRRPAGEPEDPDACRIVASQERVSIVSNGGSFGIVVGLVNYKTAYVLRARTASPEDVSVTFEPDIGTVEGRAFFVVRSISAKTGVFEIEFETPCGTKVISVDVF